MNILGISAYYHDSAACLVQNGEIIAAAQEERFTRKKHDDSFPKNAVDFSLEYSKVDLSDLDFVAYFEKPFLKFDRILESYFAYAPYGIKSFAEAIPVWQNKKFWMKENLRKELGGYKGEVLFPEHHESHAASAFYPSPFQEAAFLTLDGVGEWTTVSYGIGRGNEIEILAEIKFPHSIGLLYSTFTYYTGFEVNSGEYKVMGLAPYGEPKYADIILSELIDLKDDGSFRLNMKYFNYCAGLTMANEKFDELFGGPPRRPESRITQRDMDLARSIQVVTEEVMLRMARHVYEQTGQKNLCLAGGVALNCVGNGKILREGPFENVWIQPAAGDAGGALGAALLTWYQYLGNSRKTEGKNNFQKSSYLGPGFSNSYIEEFLKQKKVPYKAIEEENMPSIIADLIAEEKVIGWFRGRMEFGPRALGARSIIGDPRSPRMQEIMNLKIKFRESFRPFAPSIMREKVSDLFDIDKESPYMLLVAPVRQEIRKKLSEEEEKFFGIDKLKTVRSYIPAVTHVDYSARIQTVSAEDSPSYYNLINAFYKKTGCPVIINTSFNVRDEPIVCTPDEAYECFMRTKMDYLVMENYLLNKEDIRALDCDIIWDTYFRAEHAEDVKQEEDLLMASDKLKNTRKFWLALSLILLGVGIYNFYYNNTPVGTWCFVAAIPILFLSLLVPKVLKPAYSLVTIVSRKIGWYNSKLLIGVLFYFVFTPIAVIYRIIGKDPLNRKMEKYRKSYWIPRAKHAFGRKRSEYQF